MRIYVVYTWMVGCEDYDLDTAQAFLNKEDAEKYRDSFLYGDASIDYEDACICEYEVSE